MPRKPQEQGSTSTEMADKSCTKDPHTQLTADRRVFLFPGSVSYGEVNIANVIVYTCFSVRTAASVHIAKWSPDGEYFATVGKVYDSCEHIAKLNIGQFF